MIIAAMCTHLMRIQFTSVFIFLAMIKMDSLTMHSKSRKLRMSSLRMNFDTIVSVSSKFETPCSMQSDPGVTLTDYMKLPVDQYVCIKMPLDASLERMAGTRFNMTVPPVRFFNLDVSPTILCDVQQTDNSIKIMSTECILRGSPYVVGLNGCYRMKINSEFRWTDDLKKRAISSTSDIYVEVDPPAPFKYFGKTILEKTGHLALSIALSQIENAFVQALARDYEKWANSKEYRTNRAGGLCGVFKDDQKSVLAVFPSDAAFSTSSTPSTMSTSPSTFSSPTSTSTSKSIVTTITNIIENSTNEITTTDISNNLIEEEDSLGIYEGLIDDDFQVDKIVTKDSPPALTDDICLLPGSDPIVRVEVAPSNSRRVFTGVDVMAKMDTVWDVLTNYERLQDVVPSLVQNDVVER